jgi:hypothetical protein
VSDFKFRVAPPTIAPGFYPGEDYPGRITHSDEGERHRREAEDKIFWRNYQKGKGDWRDDLENHYQLWRTSEREYWLNFVATSRHSAELAKKLLRRTWTTEIGMRCDFAEIRHMVRQELGIDELLAQQGE